MVRTLFLMSLGESVTMMVLVADEEDIFVLWPCSAGKNLEWINAGLRKPAPESATTEVSEGGRG